MDLQSICETRQDDQLSLNAFRAQLIEDYSS